MCYFFVIHIRSIVPYDVKNSDGRVYPRSRQPGFVDSRSYWRPHFALASAPAQTDRTGRSQSCCPAALTSCGGSSIDCRSGQNRVNTIHRILITCIRLFVTAALMWLLAARFDIGWTANLMSHASPLLLAVALVAVSMANLIVALRWHLVLSAATRSPGPTALL